MTVITLTKQKAELIEVPIKGRTRPHPAPPRWTPSAEEHVEFIASAGLLLAIQTQSYYHNQVSFPLESADRAKRGKIAITYDNEVLTVRTLVDYEGWQWEMIYTATP
jgi:hypothetical protein